MAREIKAGLSNQGHTFIRKGRIHFLFISLATILYKMIGFAGETGGWKSHFTPEVNRKIDEWIEKNLEGTDLKFVTQLD